MNEYIEKIKKAQGDGNRMCPRCGRVAMKLPMHTNALSRREDCYVCDNCGMDEAVREFGRIPLDIDEWYLVKLWKEAQK